MLRIYAVVLEMVSDVAVIADQIERRDRDLGRQMRRALSSVALNTAEGMAQWGGHKQERYKTALGSAQEVLSCVHVAKRMRYIGTPASNVVGGGPHRRPAPSPHRRTSRCIVATTRSILSRSAASSGWM